jgi:CRISP-associated protein Cas1
MFCLKQKGKRFYISPLKIENIVISNQAMISTQAIVLALENNIDTIFMDTYGYPIGLVWLSKQGRTALICRKQPEVMVSPQGFHPVIDMVTQELNNQIHF